MVSKLAETLSNLLYYAVFLGIGLSQGPRWRWLIDTIDWNTIFLTFYGFEVKRIAASNPAGYKWKAWDHFSAIRNYLILINIRTALVATGSALLDGKLAETDVFKVVIDNLGWNLREGIYALVVIYSFYEILNIAIVFRSLALISHISKSLSSVDIFLKFKDLPAGVLAGTLVLRNFPHASYTGLTLVVYELAFIGNYSLLISWSVRGVVFASAGWLQANLENLGVPLLLEQVIPMAKPLYDTVGLDLSNAPYLVTLLFYLFWGTYGSFIGAACVGFFTSSKPSPVAKPAVEAKEEDN
jgi:hypothetical protein